MLMQYQKDKLASSIISHSFPKRFHVLRFGARSAMLCGRLSPADFHFTGLPVHPAFVV
jgi:hypothetical protein